MDTKRASHTGRPSLGDCHLSPEVHGRLASSTFTQIPAIECVSFTMPSAQFLSYRCVECHGFPHSCISLL